MEHDWVKDAVCFSRLVCMYLKVQDYFLRTVHLGKALCVCALWNEGDGSSSYCGNATSSEGMLKEGTRHHKRKLSLLAGSAVPPCRSICFLNKRTCKSVFQKLRFLFQNAAFPKCFSEEQRKFQELQRAWKAQT